MIRTTFDRFIEETLRRDRGVLVAALVGVSALAWLYLWLEADAMDRMMSGDLPMAMLPTATNAATLALVFVMWTVMMVGMMVPAASPMILFYAAMVRKNAERGTSLAAPWIFAAGYLLVWTGFSLAATGLQVLFEEISVASSMMVATSRWLSAGLLVAAGVYQWSPFKLACLAKCRSPLFFFTGHWRAGRLGALRMGAAHGLYCLGCCWALMLLLFVGGVMNLLWVALIAGFVLIEKLAPQGLLVGRIAGLGLAAAGVYVLFVP